MIFFFFLKKFVKSLVVDEKGITFAVRFRESRF